MTPELLGLVVVGVVLLVSAAPPSWAPPSSGRRSRLPRPGAGTAAALAGLGIALLVGGATGWVVGAAAAVGVRVVVPRLDGADDRRRRDLLARQAPLAVDLVSACLASGAGLEPALAAAARAVGEPTSGVLLSAVAALQLGAEPDAVWRQVAGEEGLGSLARAVARSQDSGAPLSDLLPRVADEVRAAQRARVEARIRTAAVRLTAPLGACLLPAFVLLGIVPVVASWIGVLL